MYSCTVFGSYFQSVEGYCETPILKKKLLNKNVFKEKIQTYFLLLLDKQNNGEKCTTTAY